MFRLNHNGEGIDDADTIDGARQIVQGQPPRRGRDPGRAVPVGDTSRQWGRRIRRPDGRVEDEPWPWEA